MKALRDSLVQIICVVLFGFCPTSHCSATTLSLGDTTDHLAWDYSGGGQFHNGTWNQTIPLGHINTMPTGVRAFIKFDISTLSGRSLQNATLNLPRRLDYDVTGHSIHSIGVKLVDFDAGASPFANGTPLVSRPVSHPTSISISNEGAWFSVNVTEAVQAAISRGYTYVTLCLNDDTAEAGGIAPAYVFLDSDPTLTITEAPENAIGDGATNIAWDFSTGGQFHNGSWYGVIPVGNINSGPTQVRSFLKFDISALAGRTLSAATLTLPRATAYTVSGVHNIGVNLVQYDAGSDAFTNSPELVTQNLIAGGSFDVSNAITSYSVDVTSIIQEAVDLGYDYATIRLNDNTTDAGSVSPAYVFFSPYPSLSLAEESMTVVENGVGRVSIHTVSPSQPNSVELYAATQLQTAIATATGVTPPINPTTPSAIKISLGVASDFSEGVGDADPQAYSYRRSGANDLELVGNSKAGILWAVDEFCRDILDVVWPVADGQITRVGSLQPTLKINPLRKISKPDFARRGWIIADNTDGYHYNDKICDWMSRTRQNVILNPASQLSSAQAKKLQRGIEPDTTTHSFWWLVSPDEYFDCHPDYFPFFNGDRQRGPSYDSAHVQLCVSNPDVLQKVIDKAVETFENYPEITIFGVCQNDGAGGWCQCANCKAWDGDQLNMDRYTNRLIHFVNLVAQAVAISHPDKKIGTFAYSETIWPPTIDVEPNVAITFTPAGRNYMRKLTDPSDTRNAEIMTYLTGWLAKANHVQFWEYYYYTGMERAAVPWARTLSEEFPELRDLGVKGFFSETTPRTWKGMSLFSYAFSRLSWDADLTYEQIVSDFCDERYGPAATYMEAYHLLYEDAIYAQVPVMTMLAPGEQLLPAAFTSSELAAMEDNLTDAAAIAAICGTAYQQGQISKELELFDDFLELYVDPATISGIGPNLVPNPGAESTNNDWGFDIQAGDYTGTMATTGGHSGLGSFRIQCTNASGWSRWVCNISGLTVGKKYAIRFWVKASAGVTGEVWMNQLSQRTRVAFMDSGNQWVQVICPEFTATETDGGFYMNCFGTGDVYFDDLFMAKLPD